MRFEILSVGQEKPREVAGLGLYTSCIAVNIACSAESHLDILGFGLLALVVRLIVWCVGG